MAKCRNRRLRNITLGFAQLGGVENRRSDVSLPVAGPAFARLPQSGLTWLCFLFPLIEPNRRVSRIRLSEKVSRCRPRKAGRSHTKLDRPNFSCRAGRIPFAAGSHLVLGTQPLAQPSTSMSFHSSIGMTDWSQTEIIRPPNHHSIECPDYCFLGQKGLFRSVSWLIALQMRCTRFFDGVVPK